MSPLSETYPGPQVYLKLKHIFALKAFATAGSYDGFSHFLFWIYLPQYVISFPGH